MPFILNFSSGESSSPRRSLGDLPTEIFNLIFETVLDSIGFYAALELRLISPALEPLILECVIQSSPDISRMSLDLLSKALYRRLCDYQQYKHHVIVDALHKIGEDVYNFDKWETREEVYLYLARAAARDLRHLVVIKDGGETVLYGLLDTITPIHSRASFWEGIYKLTELQKLVYFNSDHAGFQDDISNIILFTHARYTALAMSPTRCMEFLQLPDQDTLPLLMNYKSPFFGRLLDNVLRFGPNPEHQIACLLPYTDHWEARAPHSWRQALIELASDAARLGNHPIVQQVLDKLPLHVNECYFGGGIEVENCDVAPVVFRAGKSGNRELISYLLMTAPELAEYMAGGAAINGQYEALQQIIYFHPKLDKDAVHKTYRHLLSCAALSGHKLMVKWLLIVYHWESGTIMDGAICALKNGYDDLFAKILQEIAAKERYRSLQQISSVRFGQMLEGLGEWGSKNALISFLDRHVRDGKSTLETHDLRKLLKHLAERGEPELLKAFRDHSSFQRRYWPDEPSKSGWLCSWLGLLDMFLPDGHIPIDSYITEKLLISEPRKHVFLKKAYDDGRKANYRKTISL